MGRRKRKKGEEREREKKMREEMVRERSSMAKRKEDVSRFR